MVKCDDGTKFIALEKRKTLEDNDDLIINGRYIGLVIHLISPIAYNIYKSSALCRIERSERCVSQCGGN